MLVLFLWLFINSTECLFQFKYSFKPPILDDKGEVPFFEHVGNCLPDNSRIRIVPSIQDQKGLLQSKYETNFRWWEVLIDLQIFGQNRIGADGMVFWYTDRKGSIGSVFGRNDKWNGLAIMLDSYDNDHKRNNPVISGYLNNETYNYDHENDGGNSSFGECHVDYRNSPFPSQLRIQYFENKLTVWYFHGHSAKNQSHLLSQSSTSEEQQFSGLGIICMRISDVYLPKTGYFGISAMTGGFGDDHDVYSMITFSIPESKIHSRKPDASDDHTRKDYDKMVQDFESKQKEFLKKGGKIPDTPKGYENDQLQEDTYTKNLHSIYAVNAQFSQQLELLGRLMYEVKQEIFKQMPSNSQSNILLYQKELSFIKRQIQEYLDNIVTEVNKISILESHLHQLKSDLHYLSDQINRVQAMSSRGIGIYSIILLILIQTAFILTYFGLQPLRRHRNLY